MNALDPREFEPGLDRHSSRWVRLHFEERSRRGYSTEHGWIVIQMIPNLLGGLVPSEQPEERTRMTQKLALDVAVDSQISRQSARPQHDRGLRSNQRRNSGDPFLLRRFGGQLIESSPPTGTVRGSDCRSA